MKVLTEREVQVQDHVQDHGWPATAGDLPLLVKDSVLFREFMLARWAPVGLGVAWECWPPLTLHKALGTMLASRHLLEEYVTPCMR